MITPSSNGYVVGNLTQNKCNFSVAKPVITPSSNGYVVYNLTQNKCNFSVAKPVITPSSNSYVVGGTAISLTCVSSSETQGAGAYEWKFNSATLYVSTITNTKHKKIYKLYIEYIVVYIGCLIYHGKFQCETFYENLYI